MKIDKHQGDQLANRWEKVGKDAVRIQEKLATGKRLNRASDDAAGMAVAKEFEKQIREYRNASENIAAGMSALAIADGGSGAINDMLQRQRELAIQSASGTLGPDQRQAIDKEFQALSQEIERTSRSSSYNGQNLLDGSSRLSDGTGRIQAGDGEGVELSGANLSLSSLNMGSIRVDTLDGALQALGSIDAAMSQVHESRASRGSLSNRLEFALSNLGSQMIHTSEARSRIEDLDMAQGMTEKVRNDILRETNAAALSQFNQLSRSHLVALFQ
ncbi:MAG TPA: flagellin [Fibrobacteria bacterium]|nr:flagellin [Fibrobacteria bacterium]